jgi:N-acetylglucosamine-6-phosphate deacetylase
MNVLSKVKKWRKGSKTLFINPSSLLHGQSSQGQKSGMVAKLNASNFKSVKKQTKLVNSLKNKINSLKLKDSSMNVQIFLMMWLMMHVVFSYADSSSVTRYYNGRVLRDHELRQEDLWVKEGKIIAPQEKADKEEDVQGCIVAPGYIDLQINGGFGYDFSSAPDQVEQVAARLSQYGVTSFLPTLISSEAQFYRTALPHLQPRAGHQGRASILGIHLEGPFFCQEKHGAHDQTLLHEHLGAIEAVYGDLEGVKMVTLAPELEGAKEAIHFLKSKGIVVSIGHTNADYETAKEAIQAGAAMATHLFNAMPPLHHREPGAVGAILENSSMSYSVIADYIHLHPALLHLIWKMHPDGLILVTDAIEALGLAPGDYQLGKQVVHVEEKAAYIKGTKTIAGSVLSLDAAVRHLRQATECSAVEALEAASLRPARLLGIDGVKGSLNIGADADFLLLDDQLYIKACYIAGELAWK